MLKTTIKRSIDRLRSSSTVGQPYETKTIVNHYERLARENQLFASEEKLLDRYFRRGEGRILDLGCGVGRTAVALDERGFDVVAVDVSEEMVTRGATLFDHLEFQVGTATDLPFVDDAFDHVVFAYGGLDAIRPEAARRACLEEIKRVSKPGGLFVFSSHNSLYRYTSLVRNPRYFVNYHLLNGNVSNLGERYKRSVYDEGVLWHFSTPTEQIRELRSLGFDVVRVVGKRDSALRFLESQPYYVARVPPKNGVTRGGNGEDRNCR